MGLGRRGGTVASLRAAAEVCREAGLVFGSRCTGLWSREVDGGGLEAWVEGGLCTSSGKLVSEPLDSRAFSVDEGWGLGMVSKELDLLDRVPLLLLQDDELGRLGRSCRRSNTAMQSLEPS